MIVVRCYDATGLRTQQSFHDARTAGQWWDEHHTSWARLEWVEAK